MTTPAPPPPPPPPPPEAPLNPWAGRTAPLTQPWTRSSWPHRLLHVKSMASHVKDELSNSYNGVLEPRYNILSYTWGRFEDKTRQQTPIRVHGLDWPIPSIEKRHFTASALREAIQAAAGGVNHGVEWVWIDVACIPQAHPAETLRSAQIRETEIGKQVEIFNRAVEVFAWLSSVTGASIRQNGDCLPSVSNVLEGANNLVLDIRGWQAGGGRGITTRDQDAFQQHLMRLSRDVASYESWMGLVLGHSWFTSLWTLQELFIRPDAWVLFDDGPIRLREPDGSLTDRPWNLSMVKFDIFALRTLLNNHPWQSFEDFIRGSVLSDSTQAIGDRRGDSLMRLRAAKLSLQRLLDLQEEKGLDALPSTYPNAAYSLARHRCVTQPLDRILGIMQTYSISCTTRPPGQNDGQRLHALEDEFGSKLVDKAPLLSQLFMHGSPSTPPRRSWLINERCRVDSFWSFFFASHRTTKPLYSQLEVVRGLKDGQLRLRFRGLGWPLARLAAHPTDIVSADATVRLFSPLVAGREGDYLGLLVDAHVARDVLRQNTVYFSSHAEMNATAAVLERHYASAGSAAHLVYVGLLGSSFSPQLPVERYVGIVMATDPGSGESVRIGLFRWKEMYRTGGAEAHIGLGHPSMVERDLL